MKPISPLIILLGCLAISCGRTAPPPETPPTPAVPAPAPPTPTVPAPDTAGKETHIGISRAKLMKRLMKQGYAFLAGEPDNGMELYVGTLGEADGSRIFLYGPAENLNRAMMRTTIRQDDDNIELGLSSLFLFADEFGADAGTWLRHFFVDIGVGNSSETRIFNGRAIRVSYMMEAEDRMEVTLEVTEANQER